MNGAASTRLINQFLVLIKQLEYHWVGIDPGLTILFGLAFKAVIELLIPIFVASHDHKDTLPIMPHNPFYEHRTGAMIRP